MSAGIAHEINQPLTCVLTFTQNFANKYKNSLFVSIHCNASKNTEAKGFETYFLSTAKTDWERAVEARENASVTFDLPETEKKGIDFIFFDLAQNEFLQESSRLAELVQTRFEKKYQEKWGVKPDSFSLNSYDAAVILIKAIEKVYNESSPADREKLNLNRDRIREVVAQTSGYNGVSGVITFLPNGDAMKNVGIFMAKDKKYTQLGVYQIENDKLVEVK
jgi:N-acetylmuramoyl-L-alanine amidase